MIFLQKYWRVLAVALAVTVLVAWVGNTINKAIEDAEQRGRDQCRAEADAELRKRDAELRKREAETLEQEAADRDIARTTDIHWQEVSRDLQSRVDSLTAARSIDLGRLQDCARRSRAAPAGAPAAAAQPDGSAGAGRHDLPVSGDLGQQLVQYAGDCERYRQQLTALQSWVQQSR